MTESAVSIRAPRKSYGAFDALRGIDLEIQRGEVYNSMPPFGLDKVGGLVAAAGYRATAAGRLAKEDAGPPAVEA